MVVVDTPPGPVPTGTPDLEDLVARLAEDPRVAHVARLPARAARTGSLARAVPAQLERLLPSQLWSHQAAAIDALRDGRSVVLATGTGSGKSLCYQVPLAEAVTAPDPGTALLVFPTKALAQDQLRALTEAEVPGLVAAAYDGDCGPEERTWVRKHANVVLTNPEMLHQAILPNHARWGTFLHRLRYVVVDELHVLRGVFGSHVAHVLRRLRRLADHYGADPTFAFSSATIGAPDQLASQLCGAPVVALTEDGSPQGERIVIVWDPNRDESLRGSTQRDAAEVAAAAVRAGHRTITFCQSRRATELVAADVARRLPRRLRHLVRPYRAGFLAAERREIEAELFTGALRGVVATTALELGIDVGGLDACVLTGFPGTVASFRQQSGRAGRAGDAGLAVLVAGDDQLDQWFVAHPDEIVARAPEPAVVNPANPSVAGPQLACAAYELPLSHADARWWGDDLLDDTVRDLVLDDRLLLRRRRRTGPLAVWAGRGQPSHRIALRGGSPDEVVIATADGTLVGTVDAGRAGRQVHPGAIYLHHGASYRVDALDLDAGEAVVAADPGDTYTRPRSEASFEILACSATRPVGRVPLALGTVRVRSQVVGYRTYAVGSGELLGAAELDLPPTELVTRGFWFTVTPDLLGQAGLSPARWAGTLHAVEHAAIGLLPLFTICDRWDVGGVSTILQADTGLPTVVIHDAYEGGAGLAELGYEAAGELLAATAEAIGSCRCDDGCPSCVQSPKCGNGNEPLDKAGALALLGTIGLAPRP